MPLTASDLKAAADLARSVINAPPGEAGDATRTGFRLRGPKVILDLVAEVKRLQPKDPPPPPGVDYDAYDL